MKPRLFDITKLLPIRIMHQPRNVMPSALRRGELLHRMRPKLLDIAHLLPIRIIHWPNTLMRSALRMVEAL
jgi:hypothetical protein